jgi:hypothetical protein
MVIDELRASFARQAESVTPAPDPYERLRRRYRRRRAGRAGFTVAAVLLLVPALLLGIAALRPPEGRDTPASPLVQALLDSPTRGSLAHDTAFLTAIEQRSALAPARDPGPSPQPAGPREPKVLFAGDIPHGQRLALVAMPDGQVRMWFDATGTPAAALTRGPDLPLTPVLRVDATDTDNRDGVRLLLAPAGSRLERSDAAHYLADGSVRRNWTPVDGDWLAQAHHDLTPQTRVRVQRAGITVLDGEFGTSAPVAQWRMDATPVAGRGEPEPAAAQAAADAISGSTGLTPASATFQVLWSHEFPAHEPTQPTRVQVAVVAAITADGGGVYYTAGVNPDEPGVHRVGPSGSGVTGALEHSVIAVRVPVGDATGELPRLEIIAPPGAVRADVVVNGRVIASTGLTRGVGEVKLAVPTGATIPVYGQDGTVVAEGHFTDQTGSSLVPFEPEITAW